MSSHNHNHTVVTSVQGVVTARLHIDHVDMTNLVSARREATTLNFRAVDERFGTRAWFNETALSATGTHWVTTFTPMTTPIKIPSRGR